jgi:transcriptional regulator with XRE-family HTH domain
VTESALTLLIRSVMADNDLTIEAVARRAGLGRSTVGDFHTGTNTGVRPRRRTLEKLAEGLGVRPDVLLEAAGIGVADERLMIQMFRQLDPMDRKTILTTARSLINAAKTRKQDERHHR